MFCELELWAPDSKLKPSCTIFVTSETNYSAKASPSRSLARKFGTPLYVYSQRTLTEHFRRLDAALAPLDHLVCFAMKANSNLSVLRTLANLGGGFDIVSGGELRRVIAAGGDPRRCVFAGVGKTEDGN